MIETLIVPGLDGSGAGHWQRIWALQDPQADVVEQEDWHAPILSDWLHALEARIVEAPGSVIVAHSLGCLLVAQLAGRPAASHIAGALLVAPPDMARLARERPDLADFAVERPERLPFASILVASRNDPYMSWARAEVAAREWGSALIDLGRAGHINVDSGFGQWPEGPILADGLRAARRMTTQSTPSLLQRTGTPPRAAAHG